MRAARSLRNDKILADVCARAYGSGILEDRAVGDFSFCGEMEPGRRRRIDAFRRRNAGRDCETDVPGQNLLPLLADENRAVRDRVVITAVDANSKERAVVVNEWILKETPRTERREDEPDKIQELFVLPDDRYCVNDVANRRRDVVEDLERVIAD